ncbi:MAG: methyltransferase domain-containing protein [Planctomycetes bacterium]|nr:methyltransferase domain-containing protein [Planctomycetota bacterium]
MRNEADLKTQVRDFWDDRSCGEVYATGRSERDYYESHSRERYKLEPYIHDFARFVEGRGKDVLEIGVGMGADHIEWARSQPRSLTGIDLTPRAVEHTRMRLTLYGLKSEVFVGDAEKLPFDDASFDLVYSWGVLHHSPNTPEAINQVYRVLRPNGIARIMIYHKYSLTGYMLWARCGLLARRPFRSLSDIYANHLESPGTKAYSTQEARVMFGRFSQVSIRTQLSFGDLLQGAVGQRHGGMLLTVAKNLWPRWLLKRIFRGHGLGLLIEARK